MRQRAGIRAGSGAAAAPRDTRRSARRPRRRRDRRPSGRSREPTRPRWSKRWRCWKPSRKSGAVLALMGDPQRSAAAAELVRALRRVRRGATDTQRAVYDAAMDRDPAPTVAAMAAARGVSGQAIRTMVKRLHARIDDVAAEPLDLLAGLVVSAIGHIAAPGAAVAAAAGCLPGSGPSPAPRQAPAGRPAGLCEVPQRSFRSVAGRRRRRRRVRSRRRVRW